MLSFLKHIYKAYAKACRELCDCRCNEPATIIYVVLVVISAIISYATAAGKAGVDIAPEKDRGIKTNTRSTKKPLPIVYGTRRIASNDVYGFTGDNENRDLYLVMALAEGECDSIYQRDGVDQVWLGDKLYTDYGDNVSYTFYAGSTSQAVDPALHNVDPPWTDCMKNTCYLVIKLVWDRDLFRGVPVRQVELKGAKCYNFITTVTEWTDNPVFCLYDFFINQHYGIGISSAQIDIPSWTTAANYCDHKDFKINLLIDRNDNSWAIIETILSHFRGSINYWDGKYYLNYADTLDATYKELPIMTIEDKHIFQDSSGTAKIRIDQPGRFNNPTGLRVKFIDAEKKYSEDSFVVGETVGTIVDFELEGCTDREMAGKLAVSMLERLQLDRTITGVFRDECLELEPNSIVTFNSTALGISDQKMRVVSSTVQQAGLIDLALQYESDDIYNDVYDIEVEDEYVCSLPDPNATPPNLENVVIEETTYYYRLKTFSKLNITFSEPLNYAWYDHFEVWMAVTNSSLAPDVSEYEHQYNSSAQFTVDPVIEGKNYWFKLRTVNTWGVKRPLAQTITKYKKIIGKSVAVPPSVASLIAVPSDIGVNLYADKLDSPDIESYEFRFGALWDGGIFLADARAPNYSIISVKPGTFTFTVNSKGANDVYGDVAATSNQVTIYRPKYWTALSHSFACDYTTGTHDGTEHFIYGVDNYLRATHSGGSVEQDEHWHDFTISEWYDDDGDQWLPRDADVISLEGTYTSPLYTATSLGTYYVYVDLIADITVSGFASIWDNINPTVSTWTDIEAQTKTWNNLWQTSISPKVLITLLYSTDNVTWKEAGRMELCSVVVNAKYFKVEIKIEDPAYDIKAYVPEFSLELYS